jgi:transposase InsO family protein
MTHSVWISRREVEQLTGWTERTIFRKQQSEEIKARPTKEIGRNGKPVLEYSAASLPAAAQLKLMELKMAASALVPIKQSITAVATLPEPKSERVVMAMDALDEESRALATQRLKVIAPMIDFVNRTNGHKPLFRAASGEEFTTLSAIVQHLSTVTKFAERSIWDWWKRFTKDGPGALADRERSDAGTSRVFRDHPEAAAFCRNKYLNERLSVALVHRALLREWHRFSSAKAPDYKTLRVYLAREIAPLVKMIARDGDKVYKEQAAPYIIRDISKIRVNQYWISDHMIHDVWVRNDRRADNGHLVFPELAENEALRPWLTCIVDMRSRRVVAPTWCATPSSRSIGSALLLGMRLFGRPEVFYIDNGKDYNRLSDDQTGVLMRLGIQSQHCLPKHPQSKQIESFFAGLHKRFDVLWRPFYCGTSAATRPDDCAAVLNDHKKAMKTGAPSPLRAASEFIQGAACWLDEFNETPHRGQGMSGRCPADVYDAELPPARRSPVNPADVAQLFWERDTRVVCEGGGVRLDKFRFEPADADSFAALMPLVGEGPDGTPNKVIIARDPRNLSEAIALTNEREPKYLGLLRSQEMAVHGETDRDMIRLRMRKEGGVRTAVKQLLAAEARQRAIAGDVTELDALRRRAAASSVQPNIHALSVPKAVGERALPRMHVDDIADSYQEE